MHASSKIVKEIAAIVIMGVIAALIIWGLVSQDDNGGNENNYQPTESTERNTDRDTEQPEEDYDTTITDAPTAKEKVLNPNRFNFADVVYFGDELPELGFATKILPPGKYVTEGPTSNEICGLERIEGGDVGETISEIPAAGPASIETNTGDYIYVAGGDCTWELVK